MTVGTQHLKYLSLYVNRFIADYCIVTVFCYLSLGTVSVLP